MNGKIVERWASAEARPRRFCGNVGIERIIFIGFVAASSIGARAHARDVADFEQYRVIVERNIFSSRRSVGQGEEPAGQGGASVAAVPPADIRVVGVLKRDDPLLSIAIIEEGGTQRMCRIGDRIGTTTIRDIGRDTLVLESPGGRWIMEIQPGTVGHRVATPKIQRATPDAVPARRIPAVPAGGRLPVKATDIADLVRSVGFVVDLPEEGQKGLRLTRDFLGLREGDYVRCVGQQSLCTRYARQKLWQIARKYSAYGREMPAIPILVERDGIELEFLLGPII